MEFGPTEEIRDLKFHIPDLRRNTCVSHEFPEWRQPRLDFRSIAVVTGSTSL
jgi:hypothetical protein